MKITIVAGARPNFMKIAPITRAIEAARALGKSISYRLVYTGNCPLAEDRSYHFVQEDRGIQNIII